MAAALYHASLPFTLCWYSRLNFNMDTDSSIKGKQASMQAMQWLARQSRLQQIAVTEAFFKHKHKASA